VDSIQTAIATTPGLTANQKFCHGCAKPIHVAAPACPFCGAPQAHAEAPLAVHGPGALANGARAAQRVTSDQKFCGKCGVVMHESAAACPQCGAQQATSLQSTKSRTTAIAFALLLGGIGGHHFYLGNNVRGFLYLIFCFTFVPAGIAMIEAIIWLCNSDAAFAAKYAGK
jgi:TM2 domain-containing membrane protein YozV/RNA polymerase subunit RPABC4/transcription elongation factor Spt4